MSHLSNSRVLLILPKDRGLVHLNHRSAGNAQVKPSHSLTAKPEVSFHSFWDCLSNSLAAKSLCRPFYPAFFFSCPSCPEKYTATGFRCGCRQCPCPLCSRFLCLAAQKQYSAVHIPLGLVKVERHESHVQRAAEVRSSEWGFGPSVKGTSYAISQHGAPPSLALPCTWPLSLIAAKRYLEQVWQLWVCRSARL